MSRPGEYGYHSWPPEACKTAGGASNWSGLSLDERRGILYVPTESALPDFWGANRTGANLFANCLLGERIRICEGHIQLVPDPQNDNPFAWDLFLAHAGVDEPIAKALYALLTPYCRVFLDTECLLLGDDWDHQLAVAQRQSRITVVLLSAKFDKAYYQREEIAAAISLAREASQSHRVVPVYLDGATARYEDVPYGLRLKHGLHLGASQLEEIADRLRDLVARITGEQPSRCGIGSQTQSVISTRRKETAAATTQSRADLNQKIDALERVNAMFQFERNVYVGIIVCCMAVFVVSVGSAVYRSNVGAAEGTSICTSAAGLAGMISRLMNLWNRMMALVEHRPDV